MNINTQSFWVLTVLTSGPQHGYGLLKEIEILSEGTTCPQVGALYRTIDRLEADGYIEIERGDRRWSSSPLLPHHR